MNPVLYAALVWGGCVFWLSLFGFALWAGSIVVHDWRVNRSRATRSNRSLARFGSKQ